MLEFLLLAFFSDSSSDFFSQHNFDSSLPKIEVLEPTKIPQKLSAKVAPKLIEDEKTALLAQDLASGKFLFSKEADRAQYIASLTKLMTDLII
jgi:D-alanyl-D-alanine carboxypeptidase